MRPLRKTLLWQVLPLLTLILITHVTQAAKNSTSSKKARCQKQKTDCKDCILVKLLNKSSDGTSYQNSVANLENRSIVPWTIVSYSKGQTIPTTIPKITCSKQCVGFENLLNAVAIDREIIYLKKEKGFFTLHSAMMTVGCTCVHPRISEKIN
ncbi:interleukin-17F-like [Pelobates fuscus]|uniref:interleukin-17F-like n=1 Tax=Pelobates fuscus TaxID=191477 RepID=UPI002FE4F883